MLRRTFLNNIAMSSIAIPIGKLNPNFSTINRGYKKYRELSDKFLFLGTGAADWNPDDYPKEKKILTLGKYRGLSSMLYNNSILIDCGPTIPLAIKMYGININNISNILITHSHSDHFNIDSIRSIQSKRINKNRIKLWVHESLLNFYKNLAEETGCEVRTIKCFKNFSINDLDVLPVEANHYVAKTGEQCLHFILRSKKKVLFYALDGGWLTTKTWNILKTIKINTIVWDASWGGDDYFCLFSHNSIPMIRIMKRQLLRENVLNSNSKIVLSHIGRNYHSKYERMKINSASEGMIVAYDGLEMFL